LPEEAKGRIHSSTKEKITEALGVMTSYLLESAQNEGPLLEKSWKSGRPTTPKYPSILANFLGSIFKNQKVPNEEV
jgi:hypothetical protein